MHKIPSATWREKINARRDSFKDDLENAFSHKRKKPGGKATLVKMVRTRDKVISEVFASEKTYQEQLLMITEVGMPYNN